MLTLQNKNVGSCISKYIYYKSIKNKCVNAKEKLKQFEIRYVDCVIVVDTHMDLSQQQPKIYYSLIVSKSITNKNSSILGCSSTHNINSESLVQTSQGITKNK